MRRWWVALLVALSLVAAACSGGGDDDDDARDDDTTDETAVGDGEGWTILHYSMADTDLEPFLMVDVNEMGNVGSSDGFNLVGLIDRGPDYGDDDALDLGSWVGARYVQIGEGSAEVLEEFDDLNLGDPETLSGFVQRGIEDFPASHYALIISDHGASWPGVGPDESSDYDVLTLEELQGAIADGLEAAGVDRLDLLGFDACLMATYEVASAMSSVADRLLASSELEPGHGWDYNVLQVVGDDPSIDVDELGAALADGFQGQAEEYGTETDITLSLVDLTQMPTVEEAMAAFTSALVERAATVSPVVGRTRANNLSYGRNPNPSADTHMTDLGALVAEIGIEALDVSDHADAVLRALNDAVVHKVQGPGTAAFSGLSIYFPPVVRYFDDAYLSIPANGSGWVDFLSAFYDAGAAIPAEAQPRFQTDDATITFDEDGLTIEGFFDAAASAENVAQAYIEYGLVQDDGSIVYIGDEQAEVSDDGSGLVTGFYDLTTLNLTDGIDTALAYLTLSYDDDQPGFDLSIPLAYYAPGIEIDGESYEDILLEVVVDDEQNVVQETYYVYDAASGNYGEATLKPDGLLVPLVLVYEADGTETWAPTIDVGLYADLPSILYEFPSLESGSQLYIELVIVDFGGNRDSVSALVTIP